MNNLATTFLKDGRPSEAEVIRDALPSGS